MVRPKDAETSEELLEESPHHGVVPLKYVDEYLAGVALSEDANYQTAVVDVVHNLHEEELERLVTIINDTTIPNRVSLVDDEETNTENILLQIGILKYAADNMAEEVERRNSDD